MFDTADKVVAFWLEAGPSRWFKRDDGFDALCARRFSDAHFAAARREHDHWAQAADGALALLLLLDQIPRNIFRGSAHAYATDPLARWHAARAIDAGFDRQVDPALRSFFYLPYMHSEALADQDRCVELHRDLPGADPDKWARLHRDVIVRFGRFPHRNAALGRESTEEEQAWLDAGGGFG